MLLLGHRGCRGEITENTFAAFDHAIESGCDGFELDVRLSSDAVPVIWHDARVRGHFISRHGFGSLRERCLKAGRLRRRGVIELCQLEEVLARYAHVGWMDIELKVRGLEAQVAGLLRRYRPARGFVISSFRRPVLLQLHRIDPSLPLAYIFDRMPRAKVWSDLADSICEAECATGDGGASASVPRGGKESAGVDGESFVGHAPTCRGRSRRHDWG